MSETQNEYETEHKTDAEPTPYRTPWTIHSVGRQDGALTVCTGDGGPAFGVAYVPNENDELTEEQQKLHARLIVAAGTAAGKLPDKYDPVEVIQQIPEIARLIDRLHDETHEEGDPDLDQSFRTAPSRETIDRLIGVLIGAEGNGDE
jgi:hypothetical protein